MPGKDLRVIVHILNINLDCKPIWQKKKKERSFNLKRYEAITEEVDKLLKT